MSAGGAFSEQVRAWMLDTAGGGEILRAERLKTVREAWAVDLRTRAGETRPLLLRFRRPDDFGISRVYTLAREVEILRALEPSPVRAPRVVAANEEHGVALLERVAGRADFHHIADPDERERTAADFIEQLAALHRLEPEKLALGGLPLPRNAEEHALADLAVWEEVYRDAGARPDPLLTFALAWLHRNVPEDHGRTCLVQGDTGPGQFLFEDGRVTAVVDWELAHFGDPMEDLAWICIRDLFTPFGALRERFRRYAELSGNELHLPRLRYYRVSALLRTSLSTAIATQQLDPAFDAAQILTWHSVTERALCESLAEAMGVRIAPAPESEPGPPTPRSSVYDVLIAQLRSESQTAQEPWHAHRLAQAAGLADHLRLAERLGPVLDAQDREELAALLGRAPASHAEGQESLDALVRSAGSQRDAEILRYLLHREERVQRLLQPAMGEQGTPRLSAIE